MKFIRGRHRKISFFVTGLISEVGAFIPTRVPSAFNRIDFIKCAEARRFKADIIEDEKFCFRADIGHITDSGTFQIGVGFLGDIARISAVGFASNGVNDIAD